MKRPARVLLECSAVPICLCAGLSLVMLGAARFSAHYWHRFLLWNLFLAILPYVFSVSATFLSERVIRDGRAGHRWPLICTLGLWLLFFPNAPYPITDFIHMQFDPEPVWYDVRCRLHLLGPD